MPVRPGAKWRPRLSLIVFAVLLVLLLLPLFVLSLTAPDGLKGTTFFAPPIVSVVLIVLCTMGVGYIFVRALTGPVRELTARTSRLSAGDRTALAPLKHHGSQEIAELTSGLFGMADALFHRTEYISTFATHVSHEMKTPLTSMRGAVELLLEQGEEMSAGERRRFLKNVEQDTQRITALVHRLRELARAENPITSGASTLSDVISRLRNRYSSLTLHLAGNVDQPIPLTVENLEIVFTNLLDNAVDHNADAVEITLHVAGDQLVVSVADDGDGISPGNQNRVFDLFFTTRREMGGTGMGLGIVRSTLQAHGGDIDLESTDPGSGATFSITFPRGASD